MIKGYMTTDALVLLFLFFSLTVAIVIKSVQKVLPFVPFTPTLFVVSILMGKFSDDMGIIGESIHATSGIDPRGILLIFLPPLIFESSFNSDWYVFRKQAVQIFILAFPSVLVSALIIMFAIKNVIGYDDSYYTYIQAFMFGSVLSCTDTVAVLALLKEAGAPKKFSSLIEGESLLNDGTCMILFTISLELCKGGSMGVLSITTLFVELTGGAVVLGVIFGVVATELIKLFKNDPLLCYNITLVGCYLLYFTAEYVHLGIHVSGIMALVAMGLYMAAFGRTKFTTEARERVHHIWKVYVFVAETIIFILGGVIVGQRSLNNPKLIDLIGVTELLYLGGLYICMIFARFFSIGLFMPKLKKLGYGLKWTEVVALTYGGLRGAVGIAFTLILASNDFLPEKFRSISIFNMAGCAFLTLIINAPTCSSFIIWLGLCVKSDTKVKLFNKFMKICKEELEEKIDSVKTDKYLCNSNWNKVVELSGIDELHSRIKKDDRDNLDHDHQEMKQLSSQPLLQEQLDPDSNDIDANVMVEIRNRFGIALKGIFWRKFETNECTDETIKKLTECVDLDLDSVQEPMNSWDYLISEEESTIFFTIIFYLRQFPIVNHYAFSQIYQRVSSIYDLVSTYIEGIEECQEESRHFPFDRHVLDAISEEASHNKKLAQAYLDSEIKNSFPEIMKKIQTSKISISLLNYQLELLEKNHKQGRVDELFYFQMRITIENNIRQIENDNYATEEMPPADVLRRHPLFDTLDPADLEALLAERVEKLIQKDEPIVRSYERMRCVYYVAKGEVHEEWKFPNHVYHKREIKGKEFIGLSELYIAHKQEVEYSAQATSVACLYGFPIQKIKELMLRNEQFEAQMYKEMLPIIVQLTKEIDIPYIPHDVWARMRERVVYNKLSRGNSAKLEHNNIILIEGTISIAGLDNGPGHYKLLYNQIGVIQGPAKYFESRDPYTLEEIRESSKRMSDMINKGNKFNDGPTLFDKALFARE